jgi:hypothetical protein
VTGSPLLVGGAWPPAAAPGAPPPPPPPPEDRELLGFSTGLHRDTCGTQRSASSYPVVTSGDSHVMVIEREPSLS